MIDRTGLLSLFEKLISIDSPSFGERQMGDFVASQLRDLGIPVSEDAAAAKIGGNCGNLHAFLNGSSDLPPLLFCAHLDTVEPSRGKRMQIQNGVITSAGDTVLGADDCAGIASILAAAGALQKSGRDHRPIELLFTVAEEPYCRGARELDFTRIRSEEAYVFDLSGPVGEAADRAPAILSFRAVFIGRTAHAGFEPENGIHAVQAAAHAAASIPCGRIGGSTVNIGTISGGTADNIVPDCCTLTGEIRSDSNGEALRLLADVTDRVKKGAAAYGAKAEITHTLHIAAYRTDPQSPVAARFLSACERLGLSGCIHGTFGGSDNNVFAQHGIRGLVVATAMNQCHSVSEYTTEAELLRSASLALELMRSKE